MAKRDSKKSSSTPRGSGSERSSSLRDSPLNAAELALLRGGNIIYAIKAYRERRPGTSLIDAKRLCDKARVTMPPPSPGARSVPLPFNPPYRNPPKITIDVDALVLDGLMVWWAGTAHLVKEPNSAYWQVHASEAADKWLHEARERMKKARMPDDVRGG
jgi:hypothetical protein